MAERKGRARGLRGTAANLWKCSGGASGGAETYQLKTCHTLDVAILYQLYPIYGKGQKMQCVNIRIREAILKFILEAFGHCPNSFCPPPPHSNGHSGVLCLRKKCPKPSGQGSRPPQNQANSSQKSCPKPSGQGFRPLPPNGQCSNAFVSNLVGASLSCYPALSKTWWGKP